MTKNNTFSGWKVLIALTIVGAIGPMTRYSLTAFFPAISSEMGWSRSEIGLAQSISLWVYSLLAILSGWMVDRFGGRKTIFFGGLWCLIGWLLLSTVASLWQLYLYYGVVMAMATSTTHLVPTQATSRKWFIKHAGLAGGIVGSAFAVGSAILSPLLTSTSAVFGWRNVSFVCAFAFSLPVLLLAYFSVKDTPESVGQQPDGAVSPPARSYEHKPVSRDWSVRDAIRTPQLWLLFMAYGLCGLVVNAMFAHLVAWAVDLGSSVAASGVFVSLITAPSIIARVGGGWLGDRIGKRRMMLGGSVVSILVMLLGWQLIHTQNELLIFTPILGIGTSLATTLFAPYLGDLFGREKIGSLFAILTVSWGFIGGFGPILWGVLFDSYGSYTIALLVSAVCYVLALGALVLVRPLSGRVDRSHTH